MVVVRTISPYDFSPANYPMIFKYILSDFSLDKSLRVTFPGPRLETRFKTSVGYCLSRKKVQAFFVLGRDAYKLDCGELFFLSD